MHPNTQGVSPPRNLSEDLKSAWISVQQNAGQHPGACRVAWIKLYSFITTHFVNEMPKIDSPAFVKLVGEWSKKYDYPNKELDALALTDNEYYFLVDIVHIAVRSMKDVCKYKAAQDVDKFLKDVNSHSSASESTAKKPKTDNNNHVSNPHLLPSSTKFYFTQEGNIDSRTSVSICVLSPRKPVNNTFEIQSVTFAKLTQILKKRGIFETPAKHQIFYYDPENPMMTITVDDSRSFRVGIEDMVAAHNQRPSHAPGGKRMMPEIEFYIREKHTGERDTAVTAPTMTPSPSPNKSKKKRWRSKSVSRDSKDNHNYKKMRVHGERQESAV